MKIKSEKIGYRVLLATQFLGAFNDNAFRFVIAAIIVDLVDQTQGGTIYLALSGAIFILPFLVFSTFAGYLADHFSKQKIIVWTKVLELVVMGIGFWALLKGNIWPMLTVLFFMGLQSTLFSPSKYGILPEILDDKDLSEGNGTIQMWTYVAILLGQTSYGFLMQFSEPHYYKTAYVFMMIAVIGIITSLFITKVSPSGSGRKLRFNFIGEVISNVRWIKQDRAIFLSIIGLAYFGFLGGLFQLNILLYARKLLNVGHLQTGILVSFMTVGLGLGCMLAGRLSDKKVELGLVPLGAIGLSTFSIMLGMVSNAYSLALVCMFLLGLSCGFYIVPLNTLIQQKSPKDRRGQVLATNNVLSFTAILIGSLFLFYLRDLVLLNAAQIFVAVGVLTIAGTIYITTLLPYALIRFIIWILAHTLYRIKVVNRDNIPESGGVLLTPNHVSYLDAVVLVVTSQRTVRFMVHREIYNLKWLNPLLRLAQAIPVAGTDNPKEIVRSLEKATEALQNGEVVCIFPEGQLTRTGNMLKFNQGLERVMKNVDCPIIPVHLDRIWGSIFSFERGRYFFKIPKVLPYPLTISFGKPMPPNSTAFEVRNRVMELGADSIKYRLSEKLTLPESFWKEARKHPFRFCMADSSGKKLSFAAALTSSVALAGKLKSKIENEDNVGIMLPPSVPGVLVNVAVSILNKVPVNLNYTASKESLVSILDQCNMKKVITSRTFLEKTKIEIGGEKIFIEDIAQSISKADKTIAAIKSLIFPSFVSYQLIFGSRKKRNMDDLSTIMFTSGSTGEPKGVMLTHSNITSNLEGLYQIFHVQRNDVVMGILPLFHSFGFTATMWFPLISGIGVAYHVNPLDAKMIGKMVKKNEATILMSTPTFLNTYIKRCEKEQFKSLRAVVVGAEKLKDQVAHAFKEKFGIEAMEGYGCTELSPIVSLSLPDYRAKGIRQKTYKPGKIGLPLPGVAVKILNQETLAPAGLNENGLLFIKGPNVMKGYLHEEDLTSEVIKDGWYVTGDVANLDEDGFLMITDRLSRFSKIAGEMVPHIKIEERIHSLLNSSEQVCVVTSIPDEKKGEQLAVLCLKDVDVPALIDELKNDDLPNLWIPTVENFVKADAIPVLGTGKLDLGAIKRRVCEELDIK